MIQAQLSEAAQWTEARLIGQDTKFNGIAIDSRLVTPGSLFVAIQGQHFDGHAYLENAKARGACGALVSQVVSTSLPLLIVKDVIQSMGKLAAIWRRFYPLPVIGVLGSNGKTTVKEIIATIMHCHFGDSVLATLGNQNNALGTALNLLRLNSSHQVAIIEMGANAPGEITHLGQIVKPDIVVITNAGLDHIAGFGGIAGAASANGEIFATMNSKGTAIINADDPCLSIWLSQLGKRPYLKFGFNSGADVQGHWHPQIHGGELTIASPWGQIHCQLNLIGKHNALNALAAASTCLMMGVRPETIAAGLAAVNPINGRLQSHLSKSGALIIDDTYNANPSSLIAALETLSAMAGKKILVLGDMAELGDEAESWHTQAGYIARSAGVDLLFCIGHMAHFAARSFGLGGMHFHQPEALISALQPELGDGINVLLKGSRCMGLEKIVAKLL